MISIIVPIYKVENYVSRCVDSILAQTYRDIEVILVDDGSPDACPALCDAYAKQDSRVKVIHKPNGGLMSARQAGLKAATGEYIGFVDGDDWIEPDMYMHFHQAVLLYNPDIVAADFYFDSVNGSTVSEQMLTKPFYNKQQLIDEIYPEMLYRAPYYHLGIYPCCWAKLFKKELLEKCLTAVPAEIRIGEDAAFTYPSVIEAESLAYVDKPCYHYIDGRDDSMTTRYSTDTENTIFIPYHILKQKFADSGYNFLHSADYYLLYLFGFVLRNEASRSNPKSSKQIKQTLKKFTENTDLQKAVRVIRFSDLPLRTKAVNLFIRMKSPSLLYFYVKLIRRLR